MVFRLLPKQIDAKLKAKELTGTQKKSKDIKNHIAEIHRKLKRNYYSRNVGSTEVRKTSTRSLRAELETVNQQ